MRGDVVSDADVRISAYAKVSTELAGQACKVSDPRYISSNTIVHSRRCLNPRPLPGIPPTVQTDASIALSARQNLMRLLPLHDTEPESLRPSPYTIRLLLRWRFTLRLQTLAGSEEILRQGRLLGSNTAAQLNHHNESDLKALLAPVVPSTASVGLRTFFVAMGQRRCNTMVLSLASCIKQQAI